MNRTPISNAAAVTMLSIPTNCATLTPVIEHTIGVLDRCRNNRKARPAATFTMTQGVQYP